jgi:hypothetical protein
LAIIKILMDAEEFEEIQELMEDYGLEVDEAIHVKEIMDEEGLDAEDAVELKDDL